MDVVIVGISEDLIAERQRLGLDGHDEVWNGDYHMVPPPHDEHQRVGVRLLVALVPVCDRLGLEVRYEVAVIPPAESGWNDFRVPDLVVFRPEVNGGLGVVGPPELVIEVRSPGDESFEKLGFYERVGTREVVIIDRDTKAVRRWVRRDGHLEEIAPHGPDPVHQLVAVPITVHTHEGVLVVEGAGSTVQI